jgi:hypothetical protein
VGGGSGGAGNMAGASGAAPKPLAIGKSATASTQEAGPALRGKRQRHDHARIAPALAPNARWLVSDFAIPSGSVRAFAARSLVRALYFAFWAITGLKVKHLPDYQTALSSAGFACARAEIALGGVLRSELWQRD